MRPMLRRLIPVLAVAVLAPAARAAVPSPVTSLVDPCLIVCPVGDFGFTVTVRDLANNPVANSAVVLDFSQCPYFHHCLLPAGQVFNDVTRTVTGFTNALGTVSFFLPMGGVCPGNAVRIFADAVLLAQRTLASPDHDGNLFPDALDEAAITALIGTTDATADLDCNGVVDAADVAVFQRHRFHACPLVVPARSRSWGGLKTIYR
jgi:hypothetical protein